MDEAQGRRLVLTPAILGLVALVLGGTMLFLPAGVAEAASRPGEAVAWVVFIAASSLLAFPALPNARLDVSLHGPLGVASAVLLPPPLVVLVNFLGFTSDRELRRDTSLALSLFNRGQVGLCAGAASAVAGAQPYGPIVATVIAVVVYNIANIALVSAMLWATKRLSLTAAGKGTAAPFPRFAVDFGLVTLLALFVVISYEVLGVWAVVLLALPLWLGYSALKSAREAEDRAEELAVRVRELETLHDAATELLSSRRPEHAAVIAQGALATALDTTDVQVSLSGGVKEGRERVVVPGAEPAAAGVPRELSERASAVVESLVGLLGMTLVRQTLEQELAQVERARAELSGKILEEGTRERSRIALELHDDVLPSLAAAQIQADNARSAVAAGRLDRADELAAAARDAAQESIARLRQVLDDFRRQILVPGALRQGLVQALDELKVQHGVEGELCALDELPVIPFAVEILLLETVRGCIANVANHAGAGRVEVSIAAMNSHIVLEVRDDGYGFDPAAVSEGHHGLELMRQRVELARGRFDVVSAPGEGTCVHVEVPL